MELGYRAEIVSQTVLVVERKEGGFERGSQICWYVAEFWGEECILDRAKRLLGGLLAARCTGEGAIEGLL